MPERFDVATIVALKEEFAPFSDFVRVTLDKLPRRNDEPQCYSYQLNDLDGVPRRGLVTFIGEMGEVDAALHTQSLLNIYEFDLLTVVGIAGMVSDDARLGNVVYATDAEAYAKSGKWAEHPEFGGRGFPTTERIVGLLDNLSFTHTSITNAWRADVMERRQQLLGDEGIAVLTDNGLLPSEGSELLVKGPVATGPWVGASRSFKEFLKGRNRKYAAMEMETAAILSTAQKRYQGMATLVLRAISDPADERKSVIDSIQGGVVRRWSIQNAYSLLRIVLTHLSIFQKQNTPEVSQSTSVIATLHEASLRHLPGFAQTEMPEELLQLYIPLITSANLPLDATTISEHVRSSRNSIALRVDGPQGAGRSGFLALLYWHFWRELLAHRSKAIPIFVDVAKYDDARDGQLPWKGAANLRLNRDFPIFDGPPQRDEFILIIDGISDDVPEREELEIRLLVQVFGVSVRRLVGVSRRASSQLMMPAHVTDADYAVTFAPIEVQSDASLAFAERFVELTRLGGSAVTLVERAKTLDIDDFDCFTAFLVARTAPTIPTAAAAYKAWLRNLLSSDYGTGAEMAFRWEFERDSVEWDEIRTSKVWPFLNTHSSVRGFLVAEHVVAHLTTRTSKRARAHVLGHIYPFTVNRFCKDLINTSRDLQQAAFKTIQNEFGSWSAAAKTLGAYFAGRLDDRDLIVSARKFLRSQFDRLRPELNLDSAENLMLTRTLLISLIRLGDERAVDEYIDAMLTNRRLDELNRGFHLQYYHDVDYDPRNPGEHHDPLSGFPRTLKRLRERILRTSLGKQRGVIDVEVYTLASLAHHRHAARRLPDDVRIDVERTLTRAIEKNIIRSSLLRDFVDFVVRALRDVTYTDIGGFASLYRVKQLVRSGWRERNCRQVETVGAHTFGAYLMGLVLLPEKIADEPAYDKWRVLNMLLIHDLAEAFVGDLLPDKKTDQKKQEELRAFAQMRMLSTHAEFGDLFSAFELFKEYESRRTVNAMTAHDVDRLDIILQLLLHLRDGVSVDRADEWLVELQAEIVTPTGRHLLRRILWALGPTAADVG